MAMEQENHTNLLEPEHPLLNTVVLKQLFEYLNPSSASLDTLKSVRQVCRVWRDESLGWWRETAVLNLTPEMMKDPQLTIMTQILEQKPFQKYKLQDTTVNLTKVLEDENSQANRFWTTVGPHVKHLTLEWVEFTLGKSRKKGKAIKKQGPKTSLMQFLVGRLPNLRTLIVKDVKLKLGDLRFGRPLPTVGAYEALQHPNVMSLTCSNFGYFAFTNFPNLEHLAVDGLETLDAIRIERGPMDGSTLKHLDIILLEDETLRERDGTLEDLRSIKYPVLERLSVDYRHERHNSGFKFLPVFLKNHCENLKILEVTCFPYVHPYYDFPFEGQLDQLTELRLWGNVVNDLCFLKWTPKLKVLHMDVYGLEKQDNCNMDPLKSSTEYEGGYVVEALRKAKGTMKGLVLEDLTYLQINCNLFSPKKSLKALGEWMPNLKTLRTVLEPGFIGMICEQWPLLEDLVGTHGSVLEDEDIIGNKKAPKKRGLVDLVELKTFHLNSACNEGRLTAKVVRSGFLKMNKLTDLQICVSNKFSVRAEEFLKERILKAVVVRNYSGNEEHKDWKCCKDKAFIDFLKEIDGFEGSLGSDTTSEGWMEDFSDGEDDWNWNGSDSWEDVEERGEEEDGNREKEEDSDTDDGDDEEEEDGNSDDSDDEENEEMMSQDGDGD